MNSTEPPPLVATAPNSTRPSLSTVIGIAVVAYAACDMVHEVAGHGLACALTGVRALSLSTVALQTSTESRLVAAAGSMANVVAGLLAFLLARRDARSGATRYFFWLFASLNLLNGTGYLFFSGLLGIGDWSVVIARLEPPWAWRAIMAAAGAALYWLSIRLIAARAISPLLGGGADRAEIQRLVGPAYLTGGLLFVAGAALNPIGPGLILTSGVSSGFGAMAGLLVVPGLAGSRSGAPGGSGIAIPFSASWVAAGAVVALLFVALLGPGVRLP
jgi:hypothetical protein